MKVVRTIAELRAAREALAGRVGLVPTMGALHAGHLALLEAARRENEAVVMSLFVNPAQFDDPVDLAAYPRDERRDLALAEGAGVDLVFAPPGEELYPPGYETWVEVEHASRGLEGDVRPGHFRGVATVCLRLFLLVRPDRAYFGQKDAQQLRVITKMVRDLDMPVEIVPVPTVREPDGLALSSRNVYLSPDEREQALSLSRALATAQEMVAAGERRTGPIRAAMRRLIEAQPAATIDYISIADSATLEELSVIDRPALISLAVRIGATRLIDNVVID